jgi:hypothetical protein
VSKSSGFTLRNNSNIAPIKIHFYDLTGRLRYTQYGHGKNEVYIHPTHLPPGVYIAEIHEPEKVLYLKIIRH